MTERDLGTHMDKIKRRKMEDNIIMHSTLPLSLHKKYAEGKTKETGT